MLALKKINWASKGWKSTKDVIIMPRFAKFKFLLNV